MVFGANNYQEYKKGNVPLKLLVVLVYSFFNIKVQVSPKMLMSQIFVDPFPVATTLLRTTQRVFIFPSFPFQFSERKY